MPADQDPQTALIDPEIQRLIDAAEPGILDLVDAYASYESYYMTVAHVPHTGIVSGAAPY